SRVMNKIASAGVPRIEIAVKPIKKNAVRRRGGIIRESQSEYVSPLRYSSSSSFYDVLSDSAN
ncbi:hypothetical protein KI387_009226, partial [Taxus chinensis]